MSQRCQSLRKRVVRVTSAYATMAAVKGASLCDSAGLADSSSLEATSFHVLACDNPNAANALLKILEEPPQRGRG
jgi:hypothetical protein